MLLTRVKKSIDLKTRKSYQLPGDSELEELIYESLIYVATKCDPTELICSVITTETILRMIKGGQVIIEPEYPDLTNIDAHLQIDESLSYAVINYVCFLITKVAMFKQLADEGIGTYRCDYSLVEYGEEL